MPTVHEGQLNGQKKKVALVASRFNDSITTRLVSSAVDCLVRHGVDDASIGVYWVPGAFELSQLGLKLAKSGDFDGMICLGSIVRGETNHFDNLCAAVIRSVTDISVQGAIPVTYGIVTADTLEQAMNRAGGKNGNKGWDSALALVEMMSLWEA